MPSKVILKRLSNIFSCCLHIYNVAQIVTVLIEQFLGIMWYKNNVTKEVILDVKGLDEALVGHPAIQGLNLVTCVYKVKKDYTDV